MDANKREYKRELALPVPLANSIFLSAVYGQKNDLTSLFSISLWLTLFLIRVYSRFPFSLRTSVSSAVII